MSAELTIQDKLLAPLTFNKENLGTIGKTDSDSGLALILILVNSLIGGFATYQSGGGFAASFADNDTFLQLFLVGFAFQLVLYLLFSWIQGFVLRGFGGQASTAACLRILGFSSVWGIIGSLISLAAVDIGGYIGLIAFLCFAFGLSAFSGVSIVTAVIAVIVAFILAYILLFIVLFLVLVVFIFALLS